MIKGLRIGVDSQVVRMESTEAGWNNQDVCMTSDRLSDKVYRTKAGFD
jgi:hypothetical protein